MSMLINEALYFALRSINVPETLAFRAATGVVSRDPVIAALDLYIALSAAAKPCDLELMRTAALEAGHHIAGQS